MSCPRCTDFVRGLPIVAHNASFDRAFLHAELARAGLQPESEFCAPCDWHGRLAPGLPSYRLDTLVDALQVRPFKRAAIPPLAGRREPHSRHLERIARAFHRAHRPGRTARRCAEHADAQIEEASAEVSGLAAGGKWLSDFWSRGQGSFSRRRS